MYSQSMCSATTLKNLAEPAWISSDGNWRARLGGRVWARKVVWGSRHGSGSPPFETNMEQEHGMA